MGKVIIVFKDAQRESFKCKSKERAEEVVSKRLQVKSWDYFDDKKQVRSAKLDKKKVVIKKEMTLEEMERIISTF